MVCAESLGGSQQLLQVYEVALGWYPRGSSQGLYSNKIYSVYEPGYGVTVGDADDQVASHSSNEAVCLN